MEIDFKKIKKAHFIGIGGIGISAIARMMLKNGVRVSGSDRASSPITEELKKIGAKIHIGQKASQVPPDADLVVYTIAIPEDNPELKRARELGIPLLTYPQALGAVSKKRFTIAVSGTHGKTTTTAMIGKIFGDAKKDPTVVVGSLLKDAKSNLIAGRGKYFIAEACEYRRSFLNLEPKIIVITNIDNDHLDYYKDLRDIQKAFSEFVSKLGKNNYLITDANNPKIKPVAKKAVCRVVDYEKENLGDLKLLVPGKHNLANAKAALAAARIVGISKRTALKSLSSFSGTWRRFEFKGRTEAGAAVYDDYGHHPTEIEVTLLAAREFMKGKKDGPRKLTAVFHPHLYSRTKLLFEDFAKSFDLADRVLILPIYAAREKEDKSVSSEKLAAAIRKRGTPAKAVGSFKEAERILLKETGPQDLIMTIGAGDVYKVGEAIIAQKKRRNKRKT